MTIYVSLNLLHTLLIYNYLILQVNIHTTTPLEIVRTPKHGSWLNIAECELSVLLKFGLKKRTPDEKQLKLDAAAWAKYRNKKQKGVNWQFTSKDARIKLKKLYPSIID
jgi:hypothetical protein